jgi:hypothetical protein
MATARAMRLTSFAVLRIDRALAILVSSQQAVESAITVVHAATNDSCTKVGLCG